VEDEEERKKNPRTSTEVLLLKLPELQLPLLYTHTIEVEHLQGMA